MEKTGGLSSFHRKYHSLYVLTPCLCNIVKELEIIGMGLLPKITGLPMWPVGSLVAMDDEVSMWGNGRRKLSIPPKSCVEWLGL